MNVDVVSNLTSFYVTPCIEVYDKEYPLKTGGWKRYVISLSWLKWTVDISF